MSNTIKKPIIQQIGNTIKKSMGMFRRNQNKIKNLGFGKQGGKYLRNVHNFGNKSVKYLEGKGIKIFKHTAPQTARGGKHLLRTESKKNIYMRSAMWMSKTQLKPVIKRSAEQTRGKEVRSLINMVSKSKPQLPLIFGIERLTQFHLKTPYNNNDWKFKAASFDEEIIQKHEHDLASIMHKAKQSIKTNNTKDTVLNKIQKRNRGRKKRKTKQLKSVKANRKFNESIKIPKEESFVKFKKRKIKKLNNHKDVIRKYVEERRSRKHRVSIKPTSVSNHLSKIGTCSQLHAQNSIQQSLVKVNNQIIDKNITIKPFRDQVSILQQASSSKIWLFNKPAKMNCEPLDPFCRGSIFDYIEGTKKTSGYIISLGGLDTSSEGLMILTNSNEIAELMELAEMNMPKKYIVNVDGEFNEQKLQKVKEEVEIDGQKHGPFDCNIKNYQKGVTNLEIESKYYIAEEIKRIMKESKKLNVNKIIQKSLGPYKLEDLKPGEVKEVPITKEFIRMITK